MQAIKVQQFFEKNLLYMIVISMGLGTVYGLFIPQGALALKPLVPMTLFLMLYPMMIGIQVEQISKAAKNSRLILLAVFLNFLVSPLLGYGLARLFLGGSPPFAVALILLAATPCAGMVVGWTGMARGNTPLALVVVALSLVLSILTIPFTMLLLAGTMVKVEPVSLFKGTILVILVPLVLGDITRRLIIKWGGEKRFQAIKPLLAPISMLGMFSILFISLALGAQQIVSNWKSLFLIVVALVLFYALQMIVSIWLVHRFGVSPKDGIALVYSVVGKKVSLAVGLAAQFFSPLTVAMLAINPLIQAPAMAWILKRCPKLFGVNKLRKRGEIPVV